MKSISRNGQPGVKCNLKAVQGDLFLLEKCIFFVSKQPVLVDISDIHQVSFSRVGSAMSARTFDMNVVTKSGPEYTFTSINKEEHDGVDAFLKEKKVRVKNEMVPDADILAAVDDSDEEMQSVASDDDEPPRARRAGDDDDEDSDASDSEGAPFSRIIQDVVDAATRNAQVTEASSDSSGNLEFGPPFPTHSDGNISAPVRRDIPYNEGLRICYLFDYTSTEFTPDMNGISTIRPTTSMSC